MNYGDVPDLARPLFFVDGFRAKCKFLVYESRFVRRNLYFWRRKRGTDGFSFTIYTPISAHEA